uniref:Aminotransferase TOXF n=1 Tax=Cochliobolus carbonum TaxID=5017 RepID=TOXF_COCCA|nr:RecName: Full=Aminotransferase TOXF; AltName: Full=TOX2 HC-toxin biosynthesis cluster protein TOXF [Bipolaris zeicola]AAD45321.1 putative branched-chain amino acid aminotransferase [Bipolaris zeicola]
MAIPLPAFYKWDVYDSKLNNVHGHVECRYTAQTGYWSDPCFVQSPFLSVHGLAPGLNYGQQVYEGIQARRTARNEILIFRPGASADRMAKSATAVSMPPVPYELFVRSVHMAVALNADYVPPHDFHGSMYIRPCQFGSSCQIGLQPPDEFIFCVFVQPHIALHGHGSLRALIAEDFDRAATRGTGHVKIGGNYAPVIRWTQSAKKEENGGWDVLLHVDSKTQTRIDEFSTSAFIGTKYAEEQNEPPQIILPESAAAIQSITSDSVAWLAKSFGWNIVKQPVTIDELASLSEVMAVGTAAGLVPVSCIRHNSTNRTFEFPSAGPMYRQLKETLDNIQRGRSSDSFGWCEKLRYAEFVQ